MSCEHKNGVAYVEDFKRPGSLEIMRKNWTRASQPADDIHDFTNMANNYIWYNPFQQVSIKDIYPWREVNPSVPNRTNVLTIQYFPDPTQQYQPEPNAWCGIMQAFSSDFFDHSRTDSIEIMIRGDKGKLHIDLGKISEDVIPNGILDTEDKPVGGFRNGVLDEGEDVGIDGIAKPDPPELNYPRDEPKFLGKHINEVDYDFWDIDKDSLKDADEPWSYDDWFYTIYTSKYIQENGSGSINGTENSANDEGGARRPDTEDINYNTVHELTNHYYSFSFSLEKTSVDTTLIVGGNPDAGWYLYRIPFTIENVDYLVGVPLVNQIEFVRIWIDNISFVNANKSEIISIAEIVLVGYDEQENAVSNY